MSTTPFVIFFSCLINLSLQLGTQEFHQPFCYKDDATCGPESEAWDEMCHKGERQSPIDIPTNLTSWKKPNAVNFKFNRKHSANHFYTLNNGHTVKIEFKDTPTSDAKVEGYELGIPYIFGQMHFHWGMSDDKGSEHTIGGKAFPMEIHMVYYASQFKTFKEAAGAADPNALAVIGRLVNIVDENKMGKVVKNTWDTITKNFPNYNSGPKKVASKLDLTPFLPQKNAKFFRYYGSLTTPSCSQSVIWTLFEDPVIISLKQLSIFRNVKGDKGELIAGNYRPVQPIHGRVIEQMKVKN